jgi:hypothetical protein
VTQGSASGTFADRNAGAGKTVTLSGTLALTGADAGNYTVSGLSETTASILVRPIEVTADDKSKRFGEADPALTYTITSGSLVSGDLLAGGLARDSGETAGEYAIGKGTLHAGSNYGMTVLPGVFTILLATVPRGPSPTFGPGGGAIVNQFVRTPTQISNNEVSGAPVSGVAVRDMFQSGVSTIVTASNEVSPDSGISYIVTGSLDGQAGEASDAQEKGRCYIREPINTLTCEETEQR